MPAGNCDTTYPSHLNRGSSKTEVDEATHIKLPVSYLRGLVAKRVYHEHCDLPIRMDSAGDAPSSSMTSTRC